MSPMALAPRAMQAIAKNGRNPLGSTSRPPTQSASSSRSPRGYASCVAAASEPPPVTRITAATTKAAERAATPRPAINPSSDVTNSELAVAAPNEQGEAQETQGEEADVEDVGHRRDRWRGPAERLDGQCEVAQRPRDARHTHDEREQAGHRVAGCARSSRSSGPGRCCPSSIRTWPRPTRRPGVEYEPVLRTSREMKKATTNATAIPSVQRTRVGTRWVADSSSCPATAPSASVGPTGEAADSASARRTVVPPIPYKTAGWPPGLSLFAARSMAPRTSHTISRCAA